MCYPTTGPRDIIQAVKDLGFEAKLHSREVGSASANYLNHQVIRTPPSSTCLYVCKQSNLLKWNNIAEMRIFFLVSRNPRKNGEIFLLPTFAP